MARKQPSESKKEPDSVSAESGKGLSDDQGSDSTAGKAPDAQKARKNGGWREIEARREKAALKASLADVWDEDFDLDEEILADLDHTAEYFTQQDDVEEEVFTDDDVEGGDDFFDDEEV